MVFGKKKIQQPQVQEPIENLIRKAPEVQVQEEAKPTTPTAWIVSTELVSEGNYKNVIISNVLMGNVGDRLDWDE